MMLLKQILFSNMHRLTIVAGVGLLSGCATVDQIGQDFDRARAMLSAESEGPVTRIDLPPASRPSYRNGQVFIYGENQVRRVSKIEDGLVVWGNPQNELYRTRKDFFLPRAYQTSKDQVVSRKFEGNPSALWPLAVGKRVSFTEQRSIYSKKTATSKVKTRRWTCEVDDARLTRVHAGTFDTYRVTCRSYRETFRSARSYSPIQTVKWDYSPKLGHYVRRELVQTSSGRHSVHTLSAALAASQATTKRINTVLKQLKGSADNS